MKVTDRGGGVVQVDLDDAASGNRLGPELCADLVAALGRLRDEPALKTIVLGGRPDVFCAGASKETLRRVARGEVEVSEQPLAEAVLGFPLPVVGALQGHAVGGGLALALYCDLVVAAEGARFGLPFLAMGFTPGMGMTRLLPALVGDQLASEMLLTGKLYKGRELRGRGLFNDVVPASEVETVALGLARRIADKPRYVLALTKETLAAPKRRMVAGAGEPERDMHRACFSRPEIQALIEAHYLE